MQIKKATFVTSISNVGQLRDFELPEIAIAGKSNVGKSSVINFLVNQKTLAKTSSTPGRTRLINYFKVNDDFMLVDLPGYGYAKVKGEDKDNWGNLIDKYLKTSLRLAVVCVLVDIRHDPSTLDLQMVSYLNHYKIPYFIVATKSDKLSRSQILKQIACIADILNVEKSAVFATSSLKKVGKDEVLNAIEKSIENYKINLKN